MHSTNEFTHVKEQIGNLNKNEENYNFWSISNIDIWNEIQLCFERNGCVIRYYKSLFSSNFRKKDCNDLFLNKLKSPLWTYFFEFDNREKIIKWAVFIKSLCKVIKFQIMRNLAKCWSRWWKYIRLRVIERNALITLLPTKNVIINNDIHFVIHNKSSLWSVLRIVSLVPYGS